MIVFLVVLVSLLCNFIISGQADGETIVIFSSFIILIIVTGYFVLIRDIQRCIEAYSYFKENPDKLTEDIMSVIDICPKCGTTNADFVNCVNCGRDLKITKRL